MSLTSLRYVRNEIREKKEWDGVYFIFLSMTKFSEICPI